MVTKRMTFGALLAIALSTLSAAAGPAIEEPFSIGFGFSDSSDVPNCWNMTETKEVNVFPKNLFTLEVTVTGDGASAMGPTFIGRTLQECSGNGKSGSASNFQLEIKARYIGPRVPQKHFTSSENVKIEIDELSVYASALSGVTLSRDPKIQFEEITTGQQKRQQAQTVFPQEDSLQLRENYIPIIWKVDANDSGTFKTASAVRTFRLKETSPMAFALDGLEIKGRVIVQGAR